MKTTATLNHSLHTRHSMTALYRLAQTLAASENVADDWELLIDAVTARLRLMADGRSAGAGTLPPGDAAMRFQAGVLECATALEQLRSVIKDQIVTGAAHAPRRRRGESL